MSNSTSNSLYLILNNDYGVSNYYSYIHPLSSFITSILNLICTIVFSHKELRTSGPFCQYSMVNSAGATLSFAISGFMFLNRCGGSICSISTSYWTQIYTIYGIYLLGSIYYFSSSILQIAISVQLYLSIKRKLTWLAVISPYKVCLITFGKI